MKNSWRALRGLMAFAGGFLIFAGASTSDYFILELGQSEPGYVWSVMAIGVALTIPSLVHAILAGGVRK